MYQWTDVGSAHETEIMKVSTLARIAKRDMGTGCDTILAQIAERSIGVSA